MTDTAPPDESQPTFAESVIISFPTTSGKGPDATRRAAASLVYQISAQPELQQMTGLGTRLDPSKVLRLLNQHWTPRCEAPLSEDDLWEVIQETSAEVEAEKKAERAIEEKNRRQAEAEAADPNEWRDAADNADDDNAAADDDDKPKATQLRELLGGSLRNAYTILREGHKSRAVCEKIAKVEGGDWKDHQKTRKRQGRRIDIVEYQMRPYLNGLSFRDFVADPPPTVQGAALEFCRAYEDACYDGEDYPDHTDRLEVVTNFAKDKGLSADAALQAWSHFKAWRIGRVGELLGDQAQMMAAAVAPVLDFDFG